MPHADDPKRSLFTRQPVNPATYQLAWLFRYHHSRSYLASHTFNRYRAAITVVGTLPMPSTPAPFLAPNDTAVLFDGVCKLCNGWARFLIRRDRARHIKLASVQSPEGQALLAWAGLPLDRFDTLAVIENGEVYVRTDAIMRILARLPMPWPLLRLARVIPAPVRDWAYDRVARNRYRLFGRHDQCLLPSADHADRFIKAQP